MLHIRKLHPYRGNEPANDMHVDCFQLIEEQWDTSGGGGGGWKTDSPLTRADLDAAYVGVYGMASAGGCTALYGELGIDAALAEIEQEGAITRPQVEAPIGA